MSPTEIAVPLGLLAAWTVNDVEEWFTMAPWSARNAGRLRALPLRLPWPDGGMPARQAHLAIGLVGAVVATASVAGVRTGGRSGFYRAAQLAFGIHGFTHAAQSVMLRGYTPGVATGVGVVIPYWIWAMRTERRAGRGRYTGAEILAALGMVASLPAVVAVAGALSGKRAA